MCRSGTALPIKLRQCFISIRAGERGRGQRYTKYRGPLCFERPVTGFKGPRSLKTFFFRDTREEILEKLRLRYVKTFQRNKFWYRGARITSLFRSLGFLSKALISITAKNKIQETTLRNFCYYDNYKTRLSMTKYLALRNKYQKKE